MKDIFWAAFEDEIQKIAASPTVYSQRARPAQPAATPKPGLQTAMQWVRSRYSPQAVDPAQAAAASKSKLRGAVARNIGGIKAPPAAPAFTSPSKGASALMAGAKDPGPEVVHPQRSLEIKRVPGATKGRPFQPDTVTTGGKHYRPARKYRVPWRVRAKQPKPPVPLSERGPASTGKNLRYYWSGAKRRDNPPRNASEYFTDTKEGNYWVGKFKGPRENKAMSTGRDMDSWVAPRESHRVRPDNSNSWGDS